MFRNRFFNIFRNACKGHKRNLSMKISNIVPIGFGFVKTVHCKDNDKESIIMWDDDRLGHEFLIRQATTVNVNAATQLLTVTVVAIQDTSERLRETLSREICLVKQAIEWGEDGTPSEHWDELVAVRGSLSDLNHNLRVLFGYMDYAEKLATVAAEISYLSGNIAASDAICERITHATRTCNSQRQMTHELQQESLELQKMAIISAPQLEEKLFKNIKEKRPNTIS